MVPKVLLLGATGYVGGSILATLKKSYPEATFTTLVRSSSVKYPEPVIAILKQGNAEFDSTPVTRSPSHVEKLRAAGGEPVIGSLDDYELITKLSSEADVIINAADSDSIGLINAILEGQRRRKAEGRGVGALIETSGCNIFLDTSNSLGQPNPTGKVWTDSEEDIRSLTTSMPHGQVDVPLMNASEAGDVHSFIICPSAIYGTGSGPDKRDSLFARMLVSHFVQRKEVVYIGEGSNAYELVHIEDLVDLFGIVFNHALDALSIPPSTSPYERYYIASPTRVSWKDITTLFSRELYKSDHVKSPVPSSVSLDEGGPFAFMIASNMMTGGSRAAELGWKPKYTSISEEALTEQVQIVSRSLA